MHTHPTPRTIDIFRATAAAAISVPEFTREGDDPEDSALMQALNRLGWTVWRFWIGNETEGITSAQPDWAATEAFARSFSAQAEREGVDDQLFPLLHGNTVEMTPCEP